ncbi:ATP-binding cassette domain-containing protein [Candidatus Woesearchaeota archaeon]|nr:ATP-binding cassette domain-containing protein [Candidatus Woesearchaeota archaeon]
MIIHVKDLKKTFKIFKRGQGLIEALKSLFTKKFTLKEALKGITLDIAEGEIVGLIGPNGAGKSTAIKIMSGLLWPDSGEAIVTGMVPWQNRTKYVANIGVVFGQKTQMMWDLPAIDSFYMNKDLYGIPEPAFTKRLKTMIRLLEAEEITKSPVRELSLGERMRCELINALLHQPPLVFLDEPTIGLDVIAKDKLRDFILEVNKKHKTTFIVTTHDMQDIEKLCKRIIIINHGRIIYDGPLEEIKKKYFTDKHIEVKFSEKIEKFKFKGCKLKQKQDYMLEIELNTKITKVRELINHLLANYDVADITVLDPPIEEIIRKIYEE